MPLFNYFFPQELDPEFLVIWDGYESRTGKPRETLNERELIAFLTYRVEEDFVFPLNPVWMVQDGTNVWSELFEKMLAGHRCYTDRDCVCLTALPTYRYAPPTLLAQCYARWQEDRQKVLRFPDWRCWAARLLCGLPWRRGSFSK